MVDKNQALALCDEIIFPAAGDEMDDHDGVFILIIGGNNSN